MTLGQTILAMIESDVASVAGQPVINLLTELQAAKGNVLLQQASIFQFLATAPTLGIKLEIEIQQQLLTIAISKVQALVAAKAPVVPAA